MQSAALIAFLERFFHLRQVGGHFETPRHLLKWLFIGTLIGLQRLAEKLSHPMRGRLLEQVSNHSG